MTLSIYEFLRDLLFYDEDGVLKTRPIIKIILGLILVFAIVILLINAIKKEKRLANNDKIKRITFIAILSAISYVLYILKIQNIPIFLSFLDVQFSNVPALIGGFLLGPISGVIIVVIRTLLKIPQTGTGGVGELTDLIIGVFVVVISSIIYHRNKTKKNAIKALVFASLSWIFIALFINWLFIVDFYIFVMFDGNEQVIVGAVNALPFVNGVNANNYMFYYLLVGILPFNLILSSMVSLVTFLVYKRVSKLFESFDNSEESKNLIKKSN